MQQRTGSTAQMITSFSCHFSLRSTDTIKWMGLSTVVEIYLIILIIRSHKRSDITKALHSFPASYISNRILGTAAKVSLQIKKSCIVFWQLADLDFWSHLSIRRVHFACVSLQHTVEAVHSKKMASIERRCHMWQIFLKTRADYFRIQHYWEAG